MRMKPENFPERLVWYTLVGTYAIYFIGGLYITGSILGWILFIYLYRTLWTQSQTSSLKTRIAIPQIMWIWLAGIFVIELTLVASHINFDLGSSLLIKSSITWARTWALIALYLLAGSLNIRPQLLYRAVCIVCLQTLLLAPIGFLIYFANIKNPWYVSPLKIIGGPSAESLFRVGFYVMSEGNQEIRWQFFAPWAPALGLIGTIYFILALQETDKKWRWIGIIGSIFMCVVSASRVALISLPIVFLLSWLLTNFKRPSLYISLGSVSFISVIITPFLSTAFENISQKFNSYRSTSTDTRNYLYRLALDRWKNEAPIWGHGAMTLAPRFTKGETLLYIGTHHTWYGTLYINGVVGLLALAIPMICSFVDLIVKAQKSEIARVGLRIFLILFIFSFGENLETAAYFYWPALVMIGIAFKE